MNKEKTQSTTIWNNRGKTSWCIGMAMLVLLIVFSSCASKEEQYAKAVNLYETGEFAEAAKLLQRIGDYEDAPELLETIVADYHIGTTAYLSGDYVLAREVLTKLRGYADVDSYLEKLEKLPFYTDEEVSEAAFQAFRNKRKGEYQGAATLYHYSEYSDAVVQYDYTTKTYTCIMTCKYSTNVFDVFGTSTSTYYVTVQLLDSDSGLRVINYSE